jgi:glycosyltransferase involved in cell wall biosynthesis
MNVIHALAWYFPESTGGTEVYVLGLVKELTALGVVNRIAAAAAGLRSSDYVHDGMAVHRYPFVETVDLATTRGERPPQNFDAFVAWLERQPRGIYHQHSWTASCGLYHISAAKSLGFKTVLTVHVPSNICLRGTMMEFGAGPCDGRVEVVRCASCWSQGRGLPRSAARALGRLPQSISRAAYRSGAQSRLITALGARELAAARQRQIAAMAGAADRIVAVSGWLTDALRRNGIADAKLVPSRQGVDRVFVDRDFIGRAAVRCGSKNKFRLGFIGRCDPIKGLSVLLDAMKKLPRNIALELAIHALANTKQEQRHRDTLLARTAGDPRIKFMPPVARAELPAVLAGFDMLAVPSQWMETGPLVVLEAQAVGVPVLGSNLGGIAELVTPGVDGYLVPFSDPSAWADALREAVAGTLPCLGKTNVPRSARTMAVAAQDMAVLYGTLT